MAYRRGGAGDLDRVGAAGDESGQVWDLVRCCVLRDGSIATS